MIESRRSIQERLSTREALVGLMQTQPNTSVTEMAGLCGYDFLLLDGEHGLFSELDYLHTFQALSATDMMGMIRLSGHNTQAVGRYLDMGAEVIVVPNVATVEQARSLAQAMLYPPTGIRGFAATAHRSSRYGIDLAAHLKAPRAGASLIVMIESMRGVENAEQILAVDGVDGVFIGPFDLSADLGCAGDFAAADYKAAFTRVETAAIARNKWLGSAPHPGSPIDALLGRGHRLLLIGADMPLFREAMSAQISNARSNLSNARSNRTADRLLPPPEDLS